MTEQTDVFQSPAYKRSRAAYRWECTFEYFVSLLVHGAFLATLLTYMGISDAVTGIISSLVSLSFLFQIFSVFVMKRISNTKRFAIIFHSIGQLFFMLLYIIPFLPFATEHKQVLVIICVLLAYFGNYFVTSMIYQWGNSHVDPHKRASYSAGKEMLSLISGVVVTLVMGYIMDYFELTNNLEGGFIFCASAILIFVICDFICLLLIKNRIVPKSETKSVPMKTIFKNTLGNRGFINITIAYSLWNFGRYMTIGFIGTYYIKELSFTVGAVQVISIAGCLLRFIISKPFGRYSDKHSFAAGAELGLILNALSFAVCAFVSPSTRFLIVGYAIINNLSQAGLGQNFLNMSYSYVDAKYFAEASAIKNSIGGIFGFVGSLLAGKLLDLIQSNGNMLFGIPVYGQQVLACLSAAIVFSAIIFTHFVIRKQKVMVQ